MHGAIVGLDETEIGDFVEISIGVLWENNEIKFLCLGMMS
jgi:hypothetical protein